jgi:hypothetical protein
MKPAAVAPPSEPPNSTNGRNGPILVLLTSHWSAGSQSRSLLPPGFSSYSFCPFSRAAMLTILTSALLSSFSYLPLGPAARETS